jgi:hypothetical protein
MYKFNPFTGKLGVVGSGGASFSGSYNDLTDKPTIPTASDVAYDATTWDGNTDVPTKNAVRDKLESMSGGGLSHAQVLIRTLGA